MTQSPLSGSCHNEICLDIGWWCQICIWSQASVKPGGPILCIVCLSLLDLSTIWSSAVNGFKRASMSMPRDAKRWLMCSFHNSCKNTSVVSAVCVENYCNGMCELDHIPAFTKNNFTISLSLFQILSKGIVYK